jgi:hypothetical protein
MSIVSAFLTIADGLPPEQRALAFALYSEP